MHPLIYSVAAVGKTRSEIRLVASEKVAEGVAMLRLQSKSFHVMAMSSYLGQIMLHLLFALTTQLPHSARANTTKICEYRSSEKDEERDDDNFDHNGHHPCYPQLAPLLQRQQSNKDLGKSERCKLKHST